MGKIKYFHIYGNVTDSKGERHVVTIVGKFEQTRNNENVTEIIDVETKPNSFVKGELRYKTKILRRKLTLGLSICHPLDTFDEEVGVEIAKRRIENGINLGSIETNDITMLTEDAIISELVTKLNHVVGNIEDFLP